jgi:hypothetical protein
LSIRKTELLLNFAAQMRDIEREFAGAAAIDDDVYLPNFTPSGPVDAILIGMEPSLGRWARTPADATAKIAAGFRNFMWSPEDFILHYAVRRFLCSGSATYHVTDISKGAMTVKKAHSGRRARYERWLPLLVKEIQLVAKPSAHIIAMGRDVSGFLERLDLEREFASIIHYSPLANAARNAVVRGRETEYFTFARSLSLQDVVEIAADVMLENFVPVGLCEETIDRLQKATLSESRKKLAFAYSAVFTKLRETNPQG